MKRWVSIYVALLYTAICLSLLFAVSCGSRDENKADNSMQGDRKTEEVREFVNEAASQSMMEVRLAEIAIERSKLPEVEELARSIQEEHSESSANLKRIAAEKSWPVTVMLLEKHQEKIEKLLKGKREDINEDYLQMTSNTHEDAINHLEKFSNKTDDPEVASWVNATLPMLRRHLEHCKELKRTIDEAVAAQTEGEVEEEEVAP